MKRVSFYLPVFLLALVLALCLVSPVSADDGSTGDTAALTEAQPDALTEADTSVEPTVRADEESTGEAVTTEVDLVDTAVVVEEPAAEENPDPVYTATPADAGMEGADDTAVISRDSGDVPEGDPYFSVGSTTYHFVLGSCTGVTGYCESSTTPIQDALDYMEANNLTPSDRKLYIEPGTYVEQVFVDGSANGVKGLTGIEGMGTNPGEVQINVGLYVDNFTTGFSISNLTVNGWWDYASAIGISNNSGTITLTDVIATDPKPDSTGILINNNGPVILNRVSANDSGGMGAYIFATGPVTVRNSTFDGNLINVDSSPYLCGLYIYENGTGAVTLDGVSVSYNGGDGADIYASNSPVTIKNSIFNHNGSTYDDIGEYWYTTIDGWGDGLLLSGKSVNLSFVDAEYNGMRGVYSQSYSSSTGDRLIAVHNLWAGIRIMNMGTGAVTLKASATNGNGGYGTFIYTLGAVTLYDDYNGWNSGDGLYIENQDAASAVPVTMTLVTSEGNGNNGIYIMTKGAVTGTNVRANSNSYDGLEIEALGTGAVTFKIDTAQTDTYGFNETCYNGNDGYVITSGGAVSLTSLDSYNNGGNGGTIDNTASASAPVTLTTAFSPWSVSGLQYNGGYGLQINSNGLVTLKNLDASGNQEFGAFIYNIPTVGTAKPNVVLTNVYFYDNCARDGDGNCYDDGETHNGLEVVTRGLITAANISAMRNYGNGVVLNNEIDTATAGVTLNAGKGGGNSFLENRDDGLQIFTHGPVTITNIDAWSNGGDGLYVWNVSGTGGVTLKQSGSWSSSDGYGLDGNVFDANGENGLEIITKGVVNVAFQEANWNGNDGIEIIAVDGTGAVTLTGLYKQSQNVTGNGGDGISVITKGNITLNNVEADQNGGYGAYLHNASGTGLVTIKYGYFARNTFGLDVETTGAVNWTYGNAEDNYYSGAQIFNDWPDLAAKPVTVSYVSTNMNGENGLLIVSKGAVTLTNVESNNNSANAYYIYDWENWTDNLTDDQFWYYTGEVGEILSISVESNNFNPCFSVVLVSDGSFVGYACGTDGSATTELELPNDGDYYIYVWAEDGNNLHQYTIAVYDTALPGVWDYENSGASGIIVDNSEGSNAAVTINNKGWTPWTSNNGGDDMMIFSTGTVKVSNVSLNDSGNKGLYVSTNGAVTLTNVWTFANADTGAYVSTNGAVTVKASGSNDNGSEGYWINANGAVTLNDVYAYNNSSSGIWTYSGGAALFSSIGAGNNGQYGARVITPSTFTLNKSIYSYNQFNNNSADGLCVTAQGKVTITNTQASNNGWWEYDDFLEEWYPTTTAYGIYVTNANPSAPQPVVLTDVRTIKNTLDGVRVNSSGVVTISKVMTNDNNNDGLSIDQSSAPTSAYAMTITKAIADNNGWHGIYVYGLGNITLSKFEASSNRGDSGVTLNNETGTGTVTILNPSGGVSANWAFFNAGNGVTIYSNGAVSITGLEILANGLNGLSVINNGSPTSGPVTLNTIIARDNNGEGLLVFSAGVVTINNAWAISNRGDGILIFTPKNVFINYSSAINNDWAGMWIDLSPSGSLTLTGSTWFGNIRNPLPNSVNLYFAGGSLIIH